MIHMIHWTSEQKVNENYYDIEQMILIEEFRSCTGSEIRTLPDQKQAKPVMEAAMLAENYNSINPHLSSHTPQTRSFLSHKTTRML